MSDKELIKRYLDGDMDAFLVFYETCRKKFFSYLKNRFRDKAEDIYQTAFMIFLQEISCRKIEHPRSYLYKIAMSLGIKEQKRSKNPTISADQLELIAEVEDPSYPINEEELQRGLKWLAGEKPLFYDVIHLHLFEKMTFDEISDLQSENRNTITSRYRYGIHYLKKYLLTENNWQGVTNV